MTVSPEGNVCDAVTFILHQGCILSLFLIIIIIFKFLFICKKDC